MKSPTNSRIGRRYYKFYDELAYVTQSNQEFLSTTIEEKEIGDYFISEVNNDGSETILYKK